MRLNTAEQRAAYRAAMIPQGATKDQRSTELGEVYTYSRAGGIYAVGFRGTAGKPAFHYRFKDEQRREAHIAQFFTGLQEHSNSVAERRKAASAFRHDVKVGDIFRASWGYDQTNIDYYEVVALIGQHMAEVREIQQQSKETGWLQGDCVPAPGKWATEADYSDVGKAHHAEHGYYPRKDKAPKRFKIQQGYQGEPCIRVASYCHATRVKPVAEIAGVKMYGTSHWTAYA